MPLANMTPHNPILLNTGIQISQCSVHIKWIEKLAFECKNNQQKTVDQLLTLWV